MRRTANQSAAGKRGIRAVFHAGRTCPALPERQRAAALRFMKTPTVSMVAAVSILLVGCSKQDVPPGTSPSPAVEPAGKTPAAVPIAEPAMTAWQQGDQATAVAKFVGADWSSHPLFAPDSALSLSEARFNAFSDAENKVRSAELISQLDSLKQLARAVIQTGDDALAKGDTAQARKCFTSLEQCGAALNTPNRGRLVQLVGQAFQKRAKGELAKIGQ